MRTGGERRAAVKAVSPLTVTTNTLWRKTMGKLINYTIDNKLIQQRPVPCNQVELSG
jgi:hypothetical protein